MREQRGVIRTVFRVSVAVLIGMIVLGISSIRGNAAAGTAAGKVMELKEPVTVYTEKSTDSEVLVTYKAGEVLFVTGDTGDGWYTVFYRGTTGYLSKTVSSPEAEGDADGEGGTDSSGDNTGATHGLELEEFAGADQEAIDEELSQVNVESTYLVEEVQQYEESHRNAVIWVIVIAVIAFALVIAGIIAYKRNNSQPDDSGTEENADVKAKAKDKGKAKDKTKDRVSVENKDAKARISEDKLDIIDLDEE